MRGCALFVAAAALLCAAPSDSQAGKKKSRKVVKVITLPRQATVGSGLKAVKDKDTGELRAPTAEESAELATGQTSRVTKILVRADGSLTAILGDEFMNDAVAVKNADGSITTSCAPHGTKLPAPAPAAETE